jgi:hypothetical protein
MTVTGRAEMCSELQFLDEEVGNLARCRASRSRPVGASDRHVESLLLQVFLEHVEGFAEQFDGRLEEDLEEERFYVTVRRAYWAAAAASPGRKIADLLIQKLEF